MSDKKLVLVIDDEPDIMDLVVFHLEDDGFQVMKADSPSHAIQLVQKGGVELVISDVRMPEMNGVELLEKIRAIGPDKPKFIFITGFADITTDEALNKGAYKLISKPLNFELLSQTARAAIDED